MASTLKSLFWLFGARQMPDDRDVCNYVAVDDVVFFSDFLKLAI